MRAGARQGDGVGMRGYPQEERKPRSTRARSQTDSSSK